MLINTEKFLQRMTHSKKLSFIVTLNILKPLDRNNQMTVTTYRTNNSVHLFNRSSFLITLNEEEVVVKNVLYDVVIHRYISCVLKGIYIYILKLYKYGIGQWIFAKLTNQRNLLLDSCIINRPSTKHKS